MSNVSEPRFAIGTKFNTPGKNPRLAVVTDILKTFNAAGELVKVCYVSEHQFCGQTVVNRETADSTIARGLLKV